MDMDVLNIIYGTWNENTSVIIIPTYRLEVKSQKGSRNHFREDGMLTFVTHANY